MKKVKITVPCGKDCTRKVEEWVEVTGTALGPFVIHRSIQGVEGWTVTHAKTGFVVQDSIARKDHALWLAGELNGYPVWDFATPGDARNIPEKTLEKIREARAVAMRRIRLVHIHERPA